MKRAKVFVMAAVFCTALLVYAAETVKEKVLFFDDFTKDSGKWDIYAGTWEIQNGEYVAPEVCEGMAVAGDESWKDYVYEVKFKTDEPGVDSWLTAWVTFRVSDPDNWYFVLLHHTAKLIEMGKRFNGQHVSWIAGSNQEAVADPLKWHKMRVECRGANIKVFLDGKKYIDFTDPEPIENGKVGIRNVNCACRIDDVKVMELK